MLDEDPFFNPIRGVHTVRLDLCIKTDGEHEIVHLGLIFSTFPYVSS